MFTITREAINDVIIIRMNGKTDTDSVRTMQDAIDEIIGGQVLKVIIDMRNLEYLNSVTIRLLLVIYKYLSEENGELIFCGLNKVINNVFEIAGLKQIFTIEEDCKSSLNKLI